MTATTRTQTVTTAGTARQRTLRFGRVHLLIAGVVVFLLVAGGITAFAVTNQAQLAAAQEQAAAQAAAADAVLVSRYTESLATLQARGQLTLDDAVALGASGSTLLSETELATLAAIGAALAPVLEQTIPTDATGDEAKVLYASVLAMVNGAHARFGTVVTAAIAAAQSALDASTSADAATRDGLVAAQSALELAFQSRGSVLEAMTALEAAIAAVLASNAAAVAQAAAAAAAAASGASTYSYGGHTYHTGGGTGTGGGTDTGGGGDGGGGTPPPPTYTDAQARQAVVNAYPDAQPKGADCDAINWGTWSGGSTPPSPARYKIAVGGWLGYTAWSTGNAGEVHYWACY